MLRIVVVFQLVLSLTVGPTPCCCTAARLAHGPAANPRATAEGDRGPRKSCCAPPKDAAGDERAPADPTPAAPAKCPCKDAPAPDAIAAEATAGSPASPLLLDAAPEAFPPPSPAERTPNARPATAEFDGRTSAPSTADLLYAHHNLRC